MEKSKAEKSTWVKKTKILAQRRKKYLDLSRKETNLAESDKGFWCGPTPSTISASAEDPERSNILGASSLKIKVNVSAGCEKDFLSESAESHEEKEECNTKGPNTGTLIRYRLFCCQQHIIRLKPFLVRVCLCLWRLCPLYSVVILD